jgi:hypothetical protein
VAVGCDQWSEELGDYAESSCKREVGQNLRDSQILKDLKANAVSVGIMKRIEAGSSNPSDAGETEMYPLAKQSTVLSECRLSSTNPWRCGDCLWDPSTIWNTQEGVIESPINPPPFPLSAAWTPKAQEWIAVRCRMEV